MPLRGVSGVAARHFTHTGTSAGASLNTRAPMSLLGVPFWTWSAHLCRSAGMGRTGCAPACARNRRVRRTNSVSVCGCGAQCHARNDALDIGDLRAAESERIQGAGGSLIGGALCASHAREEKRQANYANTAAPRTVTGLLVAGDLFADRGLAHLSLCIEGTGAHIALAPIGRPGGDGSGKAAQENIFCLHPGIGEQRPSHGRLRLALAALQNGRTESRCPKTELRSATH